MNMQDFKGRSFLTLLDYSPEEISFLLDLSEKLKDEKKKLKDLINEKKNQKMKLILKI